MEFNITSTCRKCGREYSTRKRFNDFSGQWELDNESCEECAECMAGRTNGVVPMSPMS